MALWLTMAVLPNVQVQEPIEAGIAAFVPLSDPRIGEINNSHPRHRSFLNRFTDAFGVKRDPTILLARPNAPRWFMRADTVASFRDVLSMSVVPRSRALSIQYDRALVGTICSCLRHLPVDHRQALRAPHSNHTCNDGFA
jgi:hypothetical protein